MRTYSKDSFIAKIVRWYYGYLPSSNTCDVRKIVLFLAPWKLITNPRVFGREWPIGLVWAQVLVTWVALFSGWSEEDGAKVLLRAIAIVVLVIQGGGVVGALLTVMLTSTEDKVTSILHSDFVYNAKSFAVDAWGSIYNKVCKKVEWK